MRIALVSEHASPLAALGGVDAGGQNVHVTALALELGRLGHDVVVHTRRDDPEMPPRVALAPRVVVDHVDAGPAERLPKDELLPYMGSFARCLARAWARWQPDVVHAHFWMSGLASVEAAAPLGVPVVQTFHALGSVKRRHQGLGDTSPPERVAAEAGLLGCVDMVIATSSTEVLELERLGADTRRIRIVPCGVDTAAFRPEGPAEPRPPGQHRLVTVGRLVERKGTDDAIAALAGLAGTELVVAGGPPAESLDLDPAVTRLRRAAAALGVDDRVTFRGRVTREALPALLRSADAVVCVPWYEPFGLVPLEAMACGVPVVATAVGGLRDTVVDGLTGVLVPPRAPEALTAALNRLLGEPARARAMGRAGARRAQADYAWPGIGRATVDAYGELTRPAVAARSRERA